MRRFLVPIFLLTACAHAPRSHKLVHLGSLPPARHAASEEPLPATLFHSLDELCARPPRFSFQVLPETSAATFWESFAQLTEHLKEEKLDAVIVPFSDPKGANLALFSKFSTMNLVLARPTVFLMENGKIRDHESMVKPEKDYRDLIGHDLEESLLRKFAGAFAAGEDSLPLPGDHRKARELCKERAFWKNYLGPRLERPDYATLIGASIEDAAVEGTASHELLHAAFYVNPKLEAMVKEFWEAQISDADRQAIRKILIDEGYDVDHNVRMLYNEVLAYLLERPSDDMILGDFRPAYTEKLRKFLTDQGIVLPI